MTWRELVQARLQEMHPASLYALDEEARQFARGVLPTTNIIAHPATPASIASVALGLDALEGLNVQQAQHLINQTRLYAASRMLIVVRPNCALDDDRFRALGFMVSGVDSAENRRVYHYDLDTYKTVPDWLNTRFWAHPERWTP